VVEHLRGGKITETGNRYAEGTQAAFHLEKQNIVAMIWRMI
jgi:hypothetical protein